MRVLLVTPEFECDASPERAGWWARIVALELAKVSVAAGTWPILARKHCRPGDIARRLLLGEPEIELIGKGMKRAISGGIITVADDRLSIEFGDRHFHEIDTEETPAILKACKKSGIYPSAMIFSGAVPAGSRKPVWEPPPRGRQKGPSDEEKALFHRWRKGLGKTARAKLDRKRLRAMRSAVRSGFTMGDLTRAVDGWIRRCKEDPWRMEEMNRHELSLFLRDAAHIEEGMEARDDRVSSEVILAERETNRRRQEEVDE